MRLSVFDNDDSLGLVEVPDLRGDPLPGQIYTFDGGYIPAHDLPAPHGSQGVDNPLNDGPLLDIGETVVDVKIPAESWSDWLERNKSLLLLAGGAVVLVGVLKR